MRPIGREDTGRPDWGLGREGTWICGADQCRLFRPVTELAITGDQAASVHEPRPPARTPIPPRVCPPRFGPGAGEAGTRERGRGRDTTRSPPRCRDSAPHSSNCPPPRDAHPSCHACPRRAVRIGPSGRSPSARGTKISGPEHGTLLRLPSPRGDIRGVSHAGISSGRICSWDGTSDTVVFARRPGVPL